MRAREDAPFGEGGGEKQGRRKASPSSALPLPSFRIAAVVLGISDRKTGLERHAAPFLLLASRLSEPRKTKAGPECPLIANDRRDLVADARSSAFPRLLSLPFLRRRNSFSSSSPLRLRCMASTMKPRIYAPFFKTLRASMA